MVLNMSGKNIGFLIFVITLLSILASNIVFAATDSDTSFFDTVFEPFGGFNVAAAYAKYHMVIDTLLYFLIFIGIAQFTLKKQFSGSGGTAVVIAFGLAMAIAITVWANKTGFIIGERLGPLAGAIFVILIFVFLMKFLRGEKEGLIGPSFWIGIGATYIFLNMIFPELVESFGQNKWGRFLIGILNFLFLIAVFYGLPAYFSKHFKGEGGAEGKKEEGGWRGLFPGGKKKTEEEIEEEVEEKKEQEEEKQQLILTIKELKDVKEVYGAIKRLKEEKIDPLLTLTAQPANWASFKAGYNNTIDHLIRDTGYLEVLEEKIKYHAEKAYEQAVKRLGKGTKSARRKTNEKRLAARDIKRAIDANSFLKKMVDNVKIKLNDTRNLPKIEGAWTGGYLPGAGPGGSVTESTLLKEALDEMKMIYNVVIRLLKLEKKTLTEIV